MTTKHQAAHADFATENYAYKASISFDEYGAKWRQQCISMLVNAGYHFDEDNGRCRCAHCGHTLTYAAILLYKPTNTLIYVGEQCLDNRFALATADFQQLRKESRLNREQMRKEERIDQFYMDNEELRDLAKLAEFDFFMKDLFDKLMHDGRLSERQIEAAIKAAPRVRERAFEVQQREAAKALLLAEGVQAPEGKVTVAGEIVAIKWTEDYGYGSTEKMTVKTDAGWCVWVSVPSSIAGVERGDRVQFSATLTRSDKDPLFAFGKRPTKAIVL